MRKAWLRDLPALDVEKLEFTEVNQCYTQFEEQRKYYHEGNSTCYQLFDDDIPQELRDHIREHLDGYFKCEPTFAITRIDPGNTVPVHRDEHHRLREKHGEKGTRFLIFLEDWQSGHYFEKDEDPVVEWQRGEVYDFDHTVLHLAGNMGNRPFYSLQVTAIT